MLTGRQAPFWLDPQDPDAPFPPVALALREPDGLLAVGGDLSPRRLVNAYRQGIFPWYSEGQPILWWSPDPRMVLEPGALRVSRSLRKSLRRTPHRITLDRDFAGVIDGCAGPRRDGEGTWITPEMRTAYLRLHELGYAHSAEAWSDGTLVGGLYGVAIGRMFFGESMFARATDASKIAFVHLVRQLEAWGFGLIDCQVETEHLARFGARPLPRAEFIARMRPLLTQPPVPAPWQLELAGTAG